MSEGTLKTTLKISKNQSILNVYNSEPLN
jgi:hypothetical protein